MVFALMAAEHFAVLDESGPQDEGLRRYWGSLPRSMYTLYKSISGGVDWENAVSPLASISPMLVVCFNVFLAFTVFAVLNVVVGVFCQSAIQSAARDYHSVVEERLWEKNLFSKRMKRLFKQVDESGDGQITYKGFA